MKVFEKQIRPGIKKIVRLRLVSFVFVWLRGSYEIYDSICVLTVSVIQCDFVFGKYNPVLWGGMREKREEIRVTELSGSYNLFA